MTTAMPGTAYERYKKATRSFRDGLKMLIPSKMRLVTVTDLARAADHLLAQSIENKPVKKTPVPIHKSLLNDLEESIYLREKARLKHGAASSKSDGHQYIINVLKYCRAALFQARRNGRNHRKESSSRNRNTNNVVSQDGLEAKKQSAAKENSGATFEVLRVEEEEDDDEKDGFTESQEEAICPDEPDDEYSIESDLLHGSLEFQANLFFWSAEGLFQQVIEAYDDLSRALSKLVDSNESNDNINRQTAVLLLQKTAKVNLSIEHMESLERSFFLGRHDGLRNFYDLFVVLLFWEHVEMFPNMKPSKAIEMLAECVQHAFQTTEHEACKICCTMAESSRRDNFDMEKPFQGQDVEKLISSIITKYIGPAVKTNRTKQKKRAKERSFAMSVCSSVFLSSILAMDKNVDCSSVIPADWLEKFGCLGGASGFFDAISLLASHRIVPMERQKYDALVKKTSRKSVTEAVADAARLVNEGNNILHPQEEKTAAKNFVSLSKDIRKGFQALDSVGDAMRGPMKWLLNHLELFLANESYAHALPGSKGGSTFSLCFPLLRAFREHLENRHAPSFTAAFGLQSVAYGMYRLSQENQAKRLAIMSRLAMEKYAKSFFTCEITHFQRSAERIKVAQSELAAVSFVGGIAHRTADDEMRSLFGIILQGSDAFGEETKTLCAFLCSYLGLGNSNLGDDFMFPVLWSPLLAGSFLSAAVYQSNMRIGFHCCNDLMQIQVTLHLYNALVSKEIIGRIGILDTLNRLLEKSPQVWPSGQPQSEYLRNFFVALGVYPRDAERFVQFMRLDKDQSLTTERGHLKKKLLSITDKGKRRLIARAVRLWVAQKEHSRGAGEWYKSPMGTLTQSYDLFKHSPQVSATSERELESGFRNQAQILCDAVSKDSDFMRITWLKLGCVLDTFVLKLFDELGIASLVNTFTNIFEQSPEMMNFSLEIISRIFEYDGHKIGCLFLADMVFRELEFPEIARSCEFSQKAAEIMEDFFSEYASKDSLTFF